MKLKIAKRWWRGYYFISIVGDSLNFTITTVIVVIEVEIWSSYFLSELRS